MTNCDNHHNNSNEDMFTELFKDILIGGAIGHYIRYGTDLRPHPEDEDLGGLMVILAIGGLIFLGMLALPYFIL